MTYTFLGLPVPGDAARLADRLVLRDLRDGALIVRMRTERAVPPARAQEKTP